MNHTPSVEQLVSPRSGKPVANQFRIFCDGYTLFQSYSTVIAKKCLATGHITLDPDWNYSRTTSKYRNEFLRESTAETKAKIKSGTHSVANLN